MLTLQNCCTRMFFSKHKKPLLFTGLTLLLAAAMILSVCIGSTRLDLLDALRTLQDPQSASARILLYVRLPRTLAPVLAGLAMAVSGVLIQGVLNNALAGPNIIGVNGGAGLFALLAAVLLPIAPEAMPAAAFAGALCASMLIYLTAMKTGASRVTIVLAGVAFSGIFSAGIDTIRTLYPDVVVGANNFLIGGFSGVTLGSLTPACWYILVGLVLAFLIGPELNVLALGEDTAQTLGMHVNAVRFVLLLTASLLAGAAVSFSGLIGFVGLLVPHVVRRLFGSDHRVVLPAAALLGAAFVTLCDTLARTLFAPYEVPVGILLSLIGGPFFLVLLLQKKHRGRVYD